MDIPAPLRDMKTLTCMRNVEVLSGFQTTEVLMTLKQLDTFFMAPYQIPEGIQMRRHKPLPTKERSKNRKERHDKPEELKKATPLDEETLEKASSSLTQEEFDYWWGANRVLYDMTDYDGMLSIKNEPAIKYDPSLKNHWNDRYEEAAKETQHGTH